jgi:carotenoid 1,2-hydratase
VAPDGYLWWYIDALSDDGEHGLTIIAFVGSVFSPYYAWSRMRGMHDADNFCAINVAIYSKAEKYWTMTERSRDSVSREAHHFSVGPSNIEWEHDCLTINIDEVNVPFPSRVRGRVRVFPRGLNSFVTKLDDHGKHRWGPIAPCARVEVDLDRPNTHWRGEAYFDSNEGDEPIDTPFSEWDWSRASLKDGSTAVIYDVRQKTGEDRVLGLRFKPSGAVDAFTPPARQTLPRTFWRMNRTMRTDAAEPARVQETLEDAPFYVRSVLSSGLLGERVISMHETLSVPRLTSPIVRMMLPFRMPRRR